MVNDFFVLVVVTVAFAATAGRTAKICPFAPVIPELLAVLDVALFIRVTRVGWHYHVGARQCTGSRGLANHSRVCKHRLHRLYLHLLRLHGTIRLLLHHNHHLRLHGAAWLLSHHHARLLRGTAWLLRHHHHHHTGLLCTTWLHLHHHRLPHGLLALRLPCHHHRLTNGLLTCVHHHRLAHGLLTWVHHHRLAHAHFHILLLKWFHN